MTEGLLELLPVELHPAALEEDEAVAAGLGQQGGQLLVAEGLVADGDAHVHVAEGKGVQGRPLAGVDRGHDLGPGALAPPVGEADAYAALVEGRRALEIGKSLAGHPGLGPVDGAAVQHLLHPGQSLSRLAEGLEQPHEGRLVLSLGVLLEGVGQGQVPGLALFVEACGVGGQEGEGMIGIVLVFRQMEEDAAHVAPLRGFSLEEGGHAALG